MNQFKPLILSLDVVKKTIHPTLNSGIDLTKITSGSERELWWTGVCKHSWKRSIARHISKPICPYCSGSKVLAGFNDLLTLCPIIASQWHPAKNGKLNPTEVSKGSSKRIWWICEKGHEWKATCGDRTRVDGKDTACPTCSGYKVLIGFNALNTARPEIAAEWHPTKNGLLNPHHVTFGSNKKVWWLCNKGHEWEAVITERTRKNNKNTSCPTCSNRKILAGFNDLSTKNPVIAAQWHPTKNNELNPTQVSSGSSKRVWWLCAKGHEWQAAIGDRTGYKTGCPYCSSHKVLKGFNDLATVTPLTAIQWHPTKNGSLSPEQVTSGSNKKVWWLCDKGHEWQATCGDRLRGYNCLKCSSILSKMESEVRDFITSLGVEYVTNVRSITKGKELDIYIPEKQIAIEFNGLYWHSEFFKPKTYHYDKWLACKNNNIQLIQIWEDDWRKNAETVKSLIAYKLGFNMKSKIYARKTTIQPVFLEKAKKFLEENHIQGFAAGSYYIGLYDENNTLVALIVFKREPNERLNIIRYATSHSVIGGFTKLLNYAQQTYNPKSFITFSDNTVSNGHLYQNSGFVIDKELAPDYMYIIQGKRKHKFGYRLKRFKNDPDLMWQENLTEKQLAELNNIVRIWDAGKIKWVKNLRKI